MTRKITHDEYIERVRLAHNGEIVVMSQYISGKQPIRLRHDIDKCGYEWETSAGHMIGKGKSGCPRCAWNENASKQTLSREQFNERMREKHGDTIVLLDDLFAGTHRKYNFKHVVEGCGHVWQASATNVISRGSGCPICPPKQRAIGRRLTQEQFNKKLNDVHFGEIVAIDKYMTSQTKIRFKHNIDGCDNVWSAMPNDVLYNKKGCPICASSRGEKLVRHILSEDGLRFIEQYKMNGCKNILPLPFDFAVFRDNRLLYLIEYQGRHHYEPVEVFGGEIEFEKRRHNDNIKRTYCVTNNIHLLEIPHWLSDSEVFDLIHDTTDTLSALTPNSGVFFAF